MQNYSYIPFTAFNTKISELTSKLSLSYKSGPPEPGGGGHGDTAPLF